MIAPPRDQFMVPGGFLVSGVDADEPAWPIIRPALGRVNTSWSRAKTTKPLAGITMVAEQGRPCVGGPSAFTPDPLPATIGLTQLSYTSLLKTSSQKPGPGKPMV